MESKEKSLKIKRDEIKPISPLSREAKKKGTFLDFYNCQNDLT